MNARLCGAALASVMARLTGAQLRIADSDRMITLDAEDAPVRHKDIVFAPRDYATSCWRRCHGGVQTRRLQRRTRSSECFVGAIRWAGDRGLRGVGG